MEIDTNTLIFVIIILFIFFSSPGGDGVSSEYEFNQLGLLKEHMKMEFDLFMNMTYFENFRNITGFKLSYQDVLDNPSLNATYPIDQKDYDHWESTQEYLLLPNSIINSIQKDVWNMEKKNNIYPWNISSTLIGKVDVISNNYFDKIRMPLPRFYEPPYSINDNKPQSGDTYIEDWSNSNQGHNVTFKKGELSIKISHLDTVANQIDSRKRYKFNSQDDQFKLLTLQIDFQDKLEKEKHSLNSLAVYDIERGRILSFSDSAKFHSLFAFPHYLTILNENNSDSSKKQTEAIYSKVKNLIKEYWYHSNYVDTLTMSDIRQPYDNAINKCEYAIFLQLEPWNQYTRDEMNLIDKELHWPLGRPINISHIPPVMIKSGLMYSPDCGLTLEFNQAEGSLTAINIRTMRLHILFGIILFIAQIYLLLRQMQHTNTPSSVNKISYYCFSMMNLVDGLLACIYFISATIIPELYLPLIVSAFVSFILASIFETRYLISVCASQINEQSVSIRTLLSGNLQDEGRESARPIIIPDEASISSSLYGRVFFTLFLSAFIVLSALTWPLQIRKIFEYSSLSILYSYWVPQIFRNAIKGIQPRNVRLRNNNVANRRQNKLPLLWSFVIGTSIIRIFPIVYVFTYPSNVFRHHRDVKFAVLLSLWVCFQIAVLYSQDILGARWFLPQHTIPEGYSYFKSITLQYLSEHGDSNSTSTYAIDCAICMSEVLVNVEEVPETHKVDIYSYMITPCNHIFHTECLENWMSYKLQCPICRAPLHPI
ncbi:hypothetical protein RI543_004153 [Arxiozyma heterogenica]|uniref:RING-type E3 ubiquitin transferase n=1 Tax=Arxiozyma heterogenica TaxID=278026 RepID=A0AAN8A6D2_9SACH|nr:hypothetical protein RI543_004153 [Kazachstania heterogenica]